ncbi:unnamed protein product [Chilo suppressalis]|uniref:PHD-type domain-containing protein n=1 Tax=Chilo suppressalis TaxID=168631 RepID=A0ABN8AYN4_CHISP|nr:unnamed protein product [Chilo suppressalis]
MSTCGGCHKPTSGSDIISCSKCPKGYHHICVGVTKENFKKLSKETKNAWKCPECKKGQPKIGDNSDTPVRGSRVDVTSSESGEGNNECIALLIQKQIKDTLAAELPRIVRNTLQSELKGLRDEISALKESINFISDKYEDLKSAVGKRELDVKCLLEDNRKIELKLKDVFNRLTTFEQYSRDSNIELHGLPEFKNEDLAQTLQQIGKVVDHPIKDDEILACHRVAKMDPMTIPNMDWVKLTSTYDPH